MDPAGHGSQSCSTSAPTALLYVCSGHGIGSMVPCGHQLPTRHCPAHSSLATQELKSVVTFGILSLDPDLQ